MIPVVVSAIALSASGQPPARSAPHRHDTLAAYLSSSSWPLRASALRVATLSDRINDWILAGDPPFFDQIVAACTRVQVLDTRERLSGVGVPIPLRHDHYQLLRAYDGVRTHCAETRRVAISARNELRRLFFAHPADFERAARPLVAATRARLQHFSRVSLRPFTRASADWRLATLRLAARLGELPPAWVREMHRPALSLALTRPLPSEGSSAPVCTPESTRRNETLQVHVQGRRRYVRRCGHAHALIQVVGRSYLIGGGYCVTNPQGAIAGIGLGLITSEPSPQTGRGIVIAFQPALTEGGTTPVDDAEVEVPGLRLDASGTVTLAARLTRGTLVLQGREAGGTGILARISGAWSCG